MVLVIVKTMRLVIFWLWKWKMKMNIVFQKTHYSLDKYVHFHFHIIQYVLVNTELLKEHHSVLLWRQPRGFVWPADQLLRVLEVLWSYIHDQNSAPPATAQLSLSSTMDVLIQLCVQYMVAFKQMSLLWQLLIFLNHVPFT